MVREPMALFASKTLAPNMKSQQLEELKKEEQKIVQLKNNIDYKPRKQQKSPQKLKST